MVPVDALAITYVTVDTKQ